MISAKRLLIKLYYLFWNIVLPRKELFLHASLRNKKNIFLYFDYEREFGGYNVKITDDDINLILNLLDEYNIKSTWFTVGKIFERYPESIKEIRLHGHEIGSHTYSHIPPVSITNKLIGKDFRIFQSISEINQADIKGFHSPRSQWAYGMLKYLKQHGYAYDLIGCRKKDPIRPISVQFGSKKYLYRMYTVGDDWQLYMNNCSEDESLKYFINYVNMLKPADVAGIGFHPWVLFSDLNILKGFIKFLDYINKQEDVSIKTAHSYILQLYKE